MGATSLVKVTAACAEDCWAPVGAATAIRSNGKMARDEIRRGSISTCLMSSSALSHLRTRLLLFRSFLRRRLRGGFLLVSEPAQDVREAAIALVTGVLEHGTLLGPHGQDRCPRLRV